MAIRYWVGGTGTWDNTSTANWSTTSGGAAGASAPTVADDAIFNANSNTNTDDFTVTLGTSPACLTMVTTGIDPATAMTVAGTGSLNVRGITFTLTNKVVWTNTGTISFTASATGTKNIKTAGVSIASNISIAPTAAATYNFVDNFTTTGNFTFTRGTLLTTGNNKTLRVNQFLTSGTAAKTVNTGGPSSIFITGNNATVFDVVTGTNINWNSPNVVALNYSGSTGTRTVKLGAVFPRTLLITAGSDTFTATSGDVFGTLNFTGFSGTWSNVAISFVSLVVSTGMTVGAGAGVVTYTGTVGGGISSSGKTLDFPFTVDGAGGTLTLNDSVTVGASYTFTLTQGTVALGANTLSAGVVTSSGTSTRAVTRSTGNITVTGNAATVLTLIGTGATYGSGLEVFSNYAGSTGTRTFNSIASGVAVDINAGSDTVTFTASNTIGALDFTGFAGSWTNVGLTVNGSLTTSAGMTVGAGANTVTLAATGTLTSNGKTFDFPVTVSGTSITVTLSGALTVGTTRTATLTQGTLALGANTLTTGVFVSSGTSTRAVTRSTGNITVTGNATTVLILTGTGATYSSSLTITSNYSGATGTRTFNSIASGVAVSISAGTDTVTFTTSDSIGALDFTGFAGSWSNVALGITGLTVVSGMTVGAGANVVTFGGNGSITSNGLTLDFPCTKTDGTLTLNDNLTIGSSRLLTISGSVVLAAVVNVGVYTLSVGACTIANTNAVFILASLSFSTGGQLVLTGSGRTILESTPTSGGKVSIPPVTCSYAGAVGTRTLNITGTSYPLVSVTAGSDIVTFTASNRVGGLNFTGFSGTLANVAVFIYGNVTFSTGMTVGAGFGAMTFAATSGTQDLTSNGKTLDFPVTVNGVGGTTRLQDALTTGTDRTLTLTNGTFNANNQNVTLTTFSSSNTNVRTIALGSGTWTVNGSGDSAWNCAIASSLIVTGTGKITLTSASAKTFNSGGSSGTSTSWPILENSGAGELAILGTNSFTTIQNSVAPTAFSFPSFNTTTVTNFNVNGTAGNLVTIDSTSSGTRATLSKSSGAVSAAYLSIKDSNATGGATWSASNSVDAGNNLGWLFGGTSNFFMLF